MSDVVVLDLGYGNIPSVHGAFERVGACPRIAQDPKEIGRARALVLPGVGAFGEGALGIEPFRGEILRRLKEGASILGICLGFQLFFESSEETPQARGLSILPGRVRRLRSPRLPHIGWNVCRRVPTASKIEGLPESFWAYFAHSFVAQPEGGEVVYESVHFEPFPAILRKGRIWGVQFHPEKSYPSGDALLRAFLREAGVIF